VNERLRGWSRAAIYGSFRGACNGTRGAIGNHGAMGRAQQFFRRTAAQQTGQPRTIVRTDDNGIDPLMLGQFRDFVGRIAV
jgi:hypothetical protein